MEDIKGKGKLLCNRCQILLNDTVRYLKHLEIYKTAQETLEKELNGTVAKPVGEEVSSNANVDSLLPLEKEVEAIEEDGDPNELKNEIHGIDEEIKG